MGRKRRIRGQKLTYHITCRCVQRRFLFSDESFRLMLTVIREAKRKYGFLLYGFTLMHNHYHLILDTRRDTISTVMQFINQQISWRVNRQLGTRGHLWEKRYNDTILETNRALLEVLAYIHLNPVRAGIVEKAEDYPWSSYRHYIMDEPSDLVDFPDVYLQLSKVPERRRMMMREMTESKEPSPDGGDKPPARRPELSEQIFYGSPEFTQAMTRQHEQSLAPLRRARHQARRQRLGAQRVRKPHKL